MEPEPGFYLKHKGSKVLNFGDLTLDTRVFRIFRFEYLVRLFADKKNTLVSPNLWDDPFENFIFKQIIETGDETKMNMSTISKSFYGQCWTVNNVETDALWRIYSPNKDGVRVGTTLRKLWDSFFRLDFPNPLLSCYIGKIIYVSERALLDWYQTPVKLDLIFTDHSGVSAAQTLLCKRPEFKHENEVRLLYQSFEKDYYINNSLFSYEIDPYTLIDDLLFDPRYEGYDDARSKLQELGVVCNMNISGLYKLPNLNLKVP